MLCRTALGPLLERNIGVGINTYGIPLYGPHVSILEKAPEAQFPLLRVWGFPFFQPGLKV